MRTRSGDWKDLFGAYSLALDGKKLWLGFWATLLTLVLMAVMSTLHSFLVADNLFEGPPLRTGLDLLGAFIAGEGCAALRKGLPLFNPFGGNLVHFGLSILSWIFLLWIWTCYGGAITRLAALQYGRDELPTLREGLGMVRQRRRAYFSAPLIPVFGIFLLVLINVAVGLLGSIPLVGPIILALLMFLVVASAVVLIFLLVFGVLSFGMMLPSISMGGKSAFEGWSDAYSYVLWGLNRFICYTLLGGALGVVAVCVAHGLSVLFLFLTAHTVSLGLVNTNAADYLLEFAGVKNWGLYGSAPALMFIPGYIVVAVALVVRVLVFAYAFSYFFTANTIICFLMRKHVDRIEIDEVFVEKLEEAKVPEGAAPAEKEEKAQGPAEPSEEKPAGAGPEGEQTSE